ncbi:MAG TPA: amidohydrolase family protein [Candidatus Udaeobacter sp.]|nr:amidohydrolase family protein [Candidatus Udaeobacter sp.]
MATKAWTMNRRNFLRLTGKTLAVSAGALSGCATMSAGGGSSTARAIDIHHHYFPPELITEIKQHGKALGIEYFAPKSEKESPLSIKFPGGDRLNLGRRLAEVDKRLEVMIQGRVSIATAEVQTSAVGYELDGTQGESWSRLYNEAIQNLVKRFPNRFVGIATVPLQDPPRAAKVLEHAIVNLKMSGVTIASNVVGKYFDSKDFDPFWAKAQDLDVLMIMHPEWVAGADKMNPYSLRNICGNPADTTLSVAYMMYTGIFDRFPNLKLALLHGGGYIPYHLGRLDRGKTGASGSSAIPAKYPPSKYLKNLYFDNLVYRVETVEYLKRMVGADHVMVGTDYPYDLGDWMAVEKIETMTCTSAERQAMLHGNAKKLLKIRDSIQA